MKRYAAVLTLAVLVPCTAQAQTTVELGTGIGASIIFEEGSSITQIGVPGPGAGAFGLFGQAPLYASFLMGNGMMVLPEVAFSLVSGEGETLTTLTTSLHAGYAFQGAGGNSPYVTVNGGFQWIDYDYGSDTNFGLGARAGYRIVVNQAFAIGLEGGYRRWLSDGGYNEVVMGIRLGGVVSSPR